MINGFSYWGSKFSPNQVAFQIGYETDSNWWRQYRDPAEAIGNAILTSITNTKGVFWVDFTITQIFPLLVPASSNAATSLELGMLIVVVGFRQSRGRSRSAR